MLHVPCCRFSAVNFYTNNTFENIQKETIEIYNKWTKREFEPEQVKAVYGEQELEEHEQLSTDNIYNCSTIKTNINYRIR